MASSSPGTSFLARITLPGSKPRRILLGLGVYLVAVVVFALVAGPARLTEHTQFNHYAHLADAWLHGRHDLRNGPPGYAQGNDFAVFEGKTYISFPPFPAVLMLPFVKLAGSPEDFRDGQLIVWLAGIGPAFLFLALEKMRRTGRTQRSERANLGLSVLFAFGTVYFFTAVEGTVWFAAHVVGVGLAAAYVLVALDASMPFLAGLLLACAWMTRPPILLTAPLFLLEALRVSCTNEKGECALTDSQVSFRERVRRAWAELDKVALSQRIGPFFFPIVAAFGIASWMNFARFHNPSPTAFGHELLTVAWRSRMQHWGLFGYHYLPKNLGIWLTVMPWLPPKGSMCFEGTEPSIFSAVFTFASCVPFKVNEHGLALWFTCPIYFWLFRPKAKSYLSSVLLISTVVPALMLLMYQNGGWRQFGYRFSNDYAVLLFMLLAIGGRSLKSFFFGAAAAWSVAWNLFGAVTFDRGGLYDRFYFRESTQSVIYQPD